MTQLIAAVYTYIIKHTGNQNRAFDNTWIKVHRADLAWKRILRMINFDWTYNFVQCESRYFVAKWHMYRPAAMQQPCDVTIAGAPRCCITWHSCGCGDCCCCCCCYSCEWKVDITGSVQSLEMHKVTKSLVLLLVASSQLFTASSSAGDDVFRQLVSENFVELHIILH